jgi:hypothetical protein
MDAGTTTLIVLGGLTPFVAYGIAGVWNYWKNARPVDPRLILAERYAKGEIDDEEYGRRLSMLTYGTPWLLDHVPTLERTESSDR